MRSRAAPSRHALALVAGLALAMAGCPRSVQPPVLPDGGADGGPPPFVDSDGDGLCDANEVSRALDPTDADTDRDGYSDLVEVSNGFDPRAPASPDREVIVVLRETAGSTLRVPISLLVDGEGESFRGAFQSLPQVIDDGRSATDYFESQRAVGAEPMANVFEVVGDEIRRVIGRTQLVFEINFRAPGEEPRGCMRGYPFLYSVLREDGRLFLQRRFVLVVAPDGEMPGTGTWCGMVPCF